MYSYIKGILRDMDEESIVVETGGIGYHIYTTGQTFRYLPSVGEEVKVYTYLHVREDAMLLFGFLTKDELKIYKLLLGVSGIGPKGALAILSVMTTDDLRCIFRCNICNLWIGCMDLYIRNLLVYLRNRKMYTNLASYLFEFFLGFYR